jgi:hypothetical protein
MVTCVVTGNTDGTEIKLLAPLKAKLKLVVPFSPQPVTAVRYDAFVGAVDDPNVVKFPVIEIVYVPAA